MNQIWRISLLTFLGMFVHLSSVIAQEWCATSEVTMRSEDEDAFNNYVISFEQEGGHLNTDVKIIPVVVHVIYNDANDSAAMNFSRVQMAIDRANIYLRRQNADTANTHPNFIPVAGDTHIELCLATNTPDGNTFNGVVYTGSFEDAQLWDVTKYLNIVVDPNLFAAYASMPWELNNADAHGVFIRYPNFGYFHPGMDEVYIEGKVLVHEIGHYLGLYHTFQGGFEHLGDCSAIDDPTIGDRCADTPLDWSFFPIPGSTCDIPFRYCDNGDSIRAQVENYMHYNRDECLNMFSVDQRIRMRACLDSVRANLVSEENHSFTGISCSDVVSVRNPDADDYVYIFPNPSQDIFYIDNKKNLLIERVNVYSQLGQLIKSLNNPVQPIKIDLAQFKAGIYFIEIETANQKLVERLVKQ